MSLDDADYDLYGPLPDSSLDDLLSVAQFLIKEYPKAAIRPVLVQSYIRVVTDLENHAIPDKEHYQILSDITNQAIMMAGISNLQHLPYQILDNIFDLAKYQE